MIPNDILQHSCEHILAAAVIKLFPEAQLATGPSNHSDGFYYDIDIEKTITPLDLKSIEREMESIIFDNSPFEKYIISKSEAYVFFEKIGQSYKKEILDWIPEENVTIYKNGDFSDLCRGPHIQRTGIIKAFKLLNISGCYWRANKKHKTLQRISGIAFSSSEELDKYFLRIEEIKKRDHRKIGSNLNLFSVSDPLVGPGLITWLPNGSRIRMEIENFIRRKHFENEYEFIISPHIAKSNLWKTSGHWEFYRENMFSPMKIDEQEYILKPMNCPFHILAFKNKLRSYKELPLRFAELGTVYRYELAGTMHGLMRARGFTQDDAHIFCSWDQIEQELSEIINLTLTILKKFGFTKFEISLSTRPKKYVGSVDCWERAENSLKQAIARHNINYVIDEGGGAFYGPKIDLKLRDCLDRSWQCSTVQLDFNNPERFDLHFINSTGISERPVMIHRALLGSLERFIGILIEEYSGALPFWIASEQIRILTISDRHLEYAKEIKQILIEKNFRTKISKGNDKLGAKIRDAQLEKIPLMLIIGNKEIEQRKVKVRTRNGEDLGFMDEKELILYCESQI